MQKQTYICKLLVTSVGAPDYVPPEPFFFESDIPWKVIFWTYGMAHTALWHMGLPVGVPLWIQIEEKKKKDQQEEWKRQHDAAWAEEHKYSINNDPKAEQSLYDLHGPLYVPNSAHWRTTTLDPIIGAVGDVLIAFFTDRNWPQIIAHPFKTLNEQFIMNPFIWRKPIDWSAFGWIKDKPKDSSFQPVVTKVMAGIVDFHNDVQFYLIVILCLVVWNLLYVLRTFGSQTMWWNFQIEKQRGVSNQLLPQILTKEEQLAFKKQRYEGAFRSRFDSLKLKHVVHGTNLEIIWTIIPIFVLVGIAIPSFSVLYAVEELCEPDFTVKVIGHQWYWSYEYSDFESDAGFDSYLIPEADLSLGDFRLLSVDKNLVLPSFVNVRILVTAADVLHCWAVPSLGLKMDCIPGRLNQIGVFAVQDGTFYGQCSELCGVNHGFMPIAVTFVPSPHFII